MYIVTVLEAGSKRISSEFATRPEACRCYAHVVFAYDVVRTLEYCRDCYELQLCDGSKVFVNIIDLTQEDDK